MRLLNLIGLIVLLILTSFSYAACEGSCEIECGDGRCDVGENSYNCHEDCSRFPYDFSTNFLDPTFTKGNRSFYLEFQNRINSTLFLTIDASSLEDFVKLSVKNLTLVPLASKRVNFTVSVPRDTPPGKIRGEFKIGYEDSFKYIPLSFTVMNLRNTLVELDVLALTKEIEPDGELTFFSEIYSYESEAINLSLFYTLEDIRTGEIIHKFNRNITIFSSETFIDSLNLSDPDLFSSPIKEGQYLVEVSTLFDDDNISSSSDFFVSVPFWTPARVRIVSVLGSILFLGFAGTFFYFRYQKWKLERMRYIPPDTKKIPKKGPDMFHVGKLPEINKQAYFNPRDLTTHCLCAGSTGSGKSVTASVIAEAALLNNIPVVAFDPTNQWTGFVKQLKDKNILSYYKQFGLSDSDARSFKGLIYTVDNPEVDINIKKFMNPGEITVFNLSNLKTGEYDQAVKRIIDKIFELSWPETHDLKVFVVFDECHRLLEKYGGKGGYVALERACREFRKWGIGLLMISQVSADFKQAVAGNILTEVQMNTKNVEDIQKIAQKYGTQFSTKVTRQGVGVAMVQNPRYNDGKPWFVQFRPPLHDPHKISDEELNLYSRYSSTLDEFEAKLESVPDNVDARDAMMELKLTRNKLKEGHFKMVDIYIKSLADKVDKISRGIK